MIRQPTKGGRTVGASPSSQAVADIVNGGRGRVGAGAVCRSDSLRAGFCTSAASKGASLFKIMDTTRHKSVDTLRGYVRDADLFANHAGAGLL